MCLEAFWHNDRWPRSSVIPNLGHFYKLKCARLREEGIKCVEMRAHSATVRTQNTATRTIPIGASTS